GNAGLGIEDHVLEHGAETVRGRVDFRLCFGGELHRLRVAAAFEIEYTLWGPTVLVVADQRARGVDRDRGLAGARQAEEQRNVAFRPDVGRAMHWHHPLGWQI